MPTRLSGVLLLLVLLTAGALALPAAAVEGPAGDRPGIDEVGSQSEVSREFFPEPAEEQPFTEALVYPLLGVAIIAILVIGFLYLKWQPAFEEEEESRRR